MKCCNLVEFGVDNVEENRVGQNIEWQKNYSRLLSNLELKDIVLRNLVMRLIKGERPLMRMVLCCFLIQT